MVSSTPMMLMTTSNSISVNPARFRLPIMIIDSVQSLALRQRVHIENVVAGLRVRGRALVAAQSPCVRSRNRRVREEWISGDPPQKVHHHFFFALYILDAVDEKLQVRRVSRSTQFETDVTRIGRSLVRIDCAAQDPQRVMQLGLFLPLHR